MVLRAANDGALASAVIDLADGKLVRAGHGITREDLRDDDAVERAGDFLHALDFEAEHGEPLGQFLGRPVEINVLLEPVKGDFHCREILIEISLGDHRKKIRRKDN